jgi:type IV pilus assembly protein PilA
MFNALLVLRVIKNTYFLTQKGTFIMKTNQKGFTLIELLIAVAFVGVLASVALPAINEYQTSARIVEGVALSKTPKDLINDAASAVEVSNNIITWNARIGVAGASSKDVRSVLLTGDGTGICELCGEITITLNELNVGTITAGPNTIVYKPFKLTAVAAVGEADGTYDTFGSALEDGVLGGVEWGCASATQVVATA